MRAISAQTIKTFVNGVNESMKFVAKRCQWMQIEHQFVGEIFFYFRNLQFLIGLQGSVALAKSALFMMRYGVGNEQEVILDNK